MYCEGSLAQTFEEWEFRTGHILNLAKKVYMIETSPGFTGDCWEEISQVVVGCVYFEQTWN